VEIGILGGIASGLFGVGGGIVVVPALIYWAGFTQHKATGTSLAVLLPPIGLAATVEYYRHGNVDVPAAVILAATMFLGAWVTDDRRAAPSTGSPHPCVILCAICLANDLPDRHPPERCTNIL